MAKKREEGKKIHRVLATLGYRDIRFAGSEVWCSLDEVGDHFGTTDETSVIDEPNGTEGVARLLDAESGDPLGEARRPESDSQDASDEPEATERSKAERVEELVSKMEAPNLRTAAYLAGKTFHREAESPGHQALVTSANVAVLKAEREGIGLENLDEVRFGVCQQGEGASIELEGPSGSVTVLVEERDVSLERPWGGAYSMTKVFGTRGQS